MKIWLSVMLVVGLCLSSGRGDQPQLFSGELSVVLWEALPGQSGRPNLVLELEANHGQWQRVAGQALGYSSAVSFGLVDRGRVDGQGAQFAVRMIVAGDQWNRQDRFVSYEITLERQADGSFVGSYQGQADDQPVKGRASGQLKPVPRPVRAGFEPVKPGEHPRVLFRQSDLPRLRERLQTPMGQALWARGQAMAEHWKLSRGRGGSPGDPILMGVLYQLTGEQRFADAAQLMIEKYQVDPNAYVTEFGGGSGTCGHALANAALAYDLCVQAWPKAFREEVAERLRTELPMLLRYLNCTSHANDHPCSNYYGPGYGSAALASLVFHNEKGDPPKRPVASAEQALVLEPDKQPPPAQFDVPVVPFVAGQMPNRWLIGGPLPVQANTDVLASLGGIAAARPIAGTRAEFVSFAGGRLVKHQLQFKPLPAAALGPAGIELAKAGGTNNAVTAVFHTMLEVKQSQRIGLVRPAQTRVWLGGTELTEKRDYQLQSGWYPVTMLLASAEPPAPLDLRLVLREGAAVAWREQERELRQALWQHAQAHWEKTGADTTWTEAVQTGYQRVYRHWRLGIGDGGFQAETGNYADIASWYPLVYAALYPNVFGRPASPYPDVTHLVARRMMAVRFPDQAPPHYQKINSAAGLRADFLAASYPIVPAVYRGGLLWGWNRLVGITDVASQAKLVGQSGLAAVLAFLHYPEQDRPLPPAESMPLTWEAPGFGYHCFRNGWQGQDEFIAQVFLKASLIKGWNHPNAGTFALQGLGHDWVGGSTSRVGFREQEPVVLLPEDNIHQGACGRLIHREVAADGSATLSIDLDDVYSAPGTQLYDRNLLRDPAARKPSGISGLRALAFDYSGKSGAPLMLVMIDKINGGNRRVWQWTLPSAALGATRVTKTGFRIDFGDAAMDLTFITPSPPSVRAGADMVYLGKLDDKHSFEGAVPRVQVAGQDHFFAVATFQRGVAPPVRVEGQGLEARVSVGQQVIRFDGTRIRLGQ